MAEVVNISLTLSNPSVLQLQQVTASKSVAAVYRVHSRNIVSM